MDDFDRDFKRTSRIILGVFIVVSLIIAVWWGVVVFTVIQVSGHIHREGLKSVIEQVWNGQHGGGHEGL